MRSVVWVDAIDQMNELGQRRIPFLCIIDVEQQAPVIRPLQDIDPDCLRYHTPLGNNSRSHFQCEIDGIRQKMPRIAIAEHLSRQQYACGFGVIQAGLRRGDSFLANLTYPVPVELQGSLTEIFHTSQAPYRLLMHDQCVVFSPEPFVSIAANGQIATFPMKGTALDVPGARQRLHESPKEAAEHLTVVDLLRNDLGRIGRSVRVARYRYIDRIHSPSGGILQASSEIRAELGSSWHARIGSLLAELLPAGSVSGAPKRRTLQLIGEAEQTNRGYYTGVMGVFDGSQFCSGVLIRFIEMRSGGLAREPRLSCPRFRTGGGITIYSSEEDEYNELHAKIRLPYRS